MSDYPKFKPIPRLNRNIIITEKIDGTNGLIEVNDLGEIQAGSRNRWITPDDDNYGFAAWVLENARTLATDLGPGMHYGEWWGSGIQRGYGLTNGERRFSLFNTSRWTPQVTNSFGTPGLSAVPVIRQYTFDSEAIDESLRELRLGGSLAAPGFMNPEGVVVFHTAANTFFKVTLEKDDQPKSKAA